IPNPECRLSELQSRLARRVGERRDPAVVTEPGPVERDRFDACLDRTFGDRLAHRRRCRLDVGDLEALGDALLHGRGAGHDFVAGGAEDLGIDMLAAAMHAQPGYAEVADARAGGLGPTQSCNVLLHVRCSGKLKAFWEIRSWMTRTGPTQIRPSWLPLM